MSNGAVYTYRGSWCSEGLNTTWECDWRIVGEKGSVTWDGSDGFEAQVVAKAGGFSSECETLEIPAHHEQDRIGGHEGIIHEFVDCLQNGGNPETICSDNIKSLAMVFGAIESATKNQPVDITW